MSNLAHIVYSAFNVREVPPLSKCYECDKARSKATSAADVHLVAQPVGMSSNKELTCQEVVELATDYLENALLPATLRRMRINELLCRGLSSIS